MAGPLLALACWGIMFINAGVVFNFGLFLPDLCISFNASKFEVSVAAAIQHSLLLGTGVFGGHLVELYGCHVVCGAGSLALTLGLLLSMFTTNIIYFYLTYSVLTGIGLGFQFVPMVMAMAQGYSVRHRAVAMAVVQSGAGLGTMALAPLLQMAIDEYSWRGAYLLFAGFSMNAVPFTRIMRTSMIVPDEDQSYRKNEPRVPVSTYTSVERLQESVNYVSHALHRSQRDLSVAVRLVLHSRSNLNINTNPGSHDTLDGESAHYSRCDLHMNGGPGYHSQSREPAVPIMYEVQPAAEAKHRFVDKLRDILDFSLLSRGRFFWPWLADIILGLAMFAPLPLIKPRAILLGITPFRAALLMSIYGALNIVGRFLMGIVAMLFGGITTMLGLSICLAVTSILAPIYTTYPTMALMAVLYGLSLGGIMTVETLLAGETVEIERVHKAIGLQYSIQSIAVAISYPLAAALWETTDCVDAPFYLLAVCSGLATISLLVWHVRYRCRCQPEEQRDDALEDGDEAAYLEAPESDIT